MPSSSLTSARSVRSSWVSSDVPDADLGQAADRLDGAVADPLAEALGGPALGALGEAGDLLARVVAALFEVAADGGVVAHVPAKTASARNGTAVGSVALIRTLWQPRTPTATTDPPVSGMTA